MLNSIYGALSCTGPISVYLKFYSTVYDIETVCDIGCANFIWREPNEESYQAKH
jgi:hypothetical protein